VIEREPARGQETGGQDLVEESQGHVHAAGHGPGINGLVTEGQGQDLDQEIENQEEVEAGQGKDLAPEDEGGQGQGARGGQGLILGVGVQLRRRSGSRSKRRSRSDSRSRSSVTKTSSHKSREASKTPEKKSEIQLSIGEEMKRQRQIADIESNSFTQQNFRSDTRTVTMKADDDDDAPVEVGMEFGTSGELANLKDAKSKTEKLNSEGLINPDFFGNQDEREERYLTELFSIRQKHLSKRSI